MADNDDDAQAIDVADIDIGIGEGGQDAEK